MKMFSFLFLVLTGLLSGPASRAQLLFDVTLDTLPLLADSSSGPFSLDFQLIDGSGSPIPDGNNSVTVDHFNFNTGGSWTGPASFTLTDNTLPAFGPANTFTPGSSLSFRVTLTVNVDAGGTPDQFSFAILDGNGQEIPTTGLGDAFVSVDINSAIPTVNSFASDFPGRTSLNITEPAITPVPEPASLGLLAGGLCVGFALLRSRRAREWGTRSHFQSAN